MEARHYNNLSTFRILFLVKGILTLLFSLFFVMYMGFGFFMNSTIDSAGSGSIEFDPSYIFVIIGAIGAIFCIVLGILTLLASKYLKQTRNYQFIFIMPIINCLTGLLGILLGVFTLIELNKPHVKQLFSPNSNTK